MCFFFRLLQTFHMKTPDCGCLAIVLRTGFQTTQGKLMLTVLFITERVNLYIASHFLFILWADSIEQRTLQDGPVMMIFTSLGPILVIKIITMGYNLIYGNINCFLPFIHIRY